jgi:hypothetical protein
VTIATYGKTMEEPPTHVTETLQMTKSTTRHRLKELKIRLHTIPLTVKTAAVPVFKLWM